MKATILLAVCILCGESKLEYEFTGTGTSSPALHSFIGTAVRHERQVGVCTYEEIEMRVATAFCDSNFGQRYLDIKLDCFGNDTKSDVSTRVFIGSCSRNENGRFCFEFQLVIDNYSIRKLSFYYTSPLQSSCPSLNNYSNYECTDICRAALQSFKSKIGCCLNSYYNITDYDSNLLYNKVGLWSACSVSSPSFCQVSTVTLGSSQVINRNCSSAELMEQIYKHLYCDAQIYQPIRDIYQQCERPEYELFIAECGLSETNQLCGILLINYSYPQAVESQCQNYTQGCTHSCHTALNNFKTAFGCCVNIYNDSYSFYHNTTNPALWSACGIPTPGFCPSTLSPQPTRSPNDSITASSTTRVFLLSSQPPSSSESNAALKLDFSNITMILVLLVVLTCRVSYI